MIPLQQLKPCRLCWTALLLLGFLLFNSLSAAAQTRGMGGVVRVKTLAGRNIELYKGSYALVVGVSKYTTGWSQLESVPDEVSQVSVLLRKQGFQVTQVLDPDAEKLEQAFDDFIERYGYQKQNRLLFFFSGHGYSPKGSNKGFLVPTDAPDPSRNRIGFKRKSLPMTQILAWAREMDAKHSLFLFDSCFSGTVFKTKSRPVPRHISLKTAHPVRQFISAGSASQEVPAKSVFTPSLIRALEGEADRCPKDGYVSGSELGEYLLEKVAYYNPAQTPQYGKIRDPELDQGDFVFVLTGGTDIAPDPRKQRITQLLREADVLIQAGSLTTPTGSNALERYKAVLALDPLNTEGLAGFNRIVNKYADWAKIRIKAQDYAKAEQFLNRAGQVLEGNERVMKLRDELRKAQQIKSAKAPSLIYTEKHLDTTSVPMQVHEPKGLWRNNKVSGRLFIIQGSVINQHKTARTQVLVQGKLSDSKDNAVAKATVYAGPRFTPEELTSMPLKDIQARLSSPKAMDGNLYVVPPGEKLSFMVVFGNLPDDLALYTVQVTGSLPLEKTDKTTLYTVRRGDSLFDIALRYKVTVREIKRRNSLINNKLEAGRVLVIPKLSDNPKLFIEPEIADEPESKIIWVAKKLGPLGIAIPSNWKERRTSNHKSAFWSLGDSNPPEVGVFAIMSDSKSSLMHDLQEVKKSLTSISGYLAEINHGWSPGKQAKATFIVFDKEFDDQTLTIGLISTEWQVYQPLLDAIFDSVCINRGPDLPDIEAELRKPLKSVLKPNMQLNRRNSPKKPESSASRNTHLDHAINELKFLVTQEPLPKNPMLVTDTSRNKTEIHKRKTASLTMRQQIYNAEVESRIKRQWVLPEAYVKETSGLVAWVVLQIKWDGHLAKVWLERSSGNSRFDRSCLRAVKKAAPFPTLPPEEKGQTMELGIRFRPGDIG